MHVENIYTLRDTISWKESQISISYKLRHALEKFTTTKSSHKLFIFLIFCQRSNKRLYQGNKFKLNFLFNLEKKLIPFNVYFLSLCKVVGSNFNQTKKHLVGLFRNICLDNSCGKIKKR